MKKNKTIHKILFAIIYSATIKKKLLYFLPKLRKWSNWKWFCGWSCLVCLCVSFFSISFFFFLNERFKFKRQPTIRVPYTPNLCVFKLTKTIWRQRLLLWQIEYPAFDMIVVVLPISNSIFLIKSKRTKAKIFAQQQQQQRIRKTRRMKSKQCIELTRSYFKNEVENELLKQRKRISKKVFIYRNFHSCRSQAFS